MEKKGKKSDEYKSVFGNRGKDKSGAGSSADWSTVPDTVLRGLLDAVTSRGGAIRFGYTRDGGAYAVGFYYGSESTTEYCRPTESIEDFCKGWTDFYLNLAYTGGKSPSS